MFEWLMVSPAYRGVCDAGIVDDMTWGILALLLTGAGGAATWWCFTRRGALAGATALGWTLLVPAAWLTGLLELVTRVATAVSRWASQLVFSPTFWIGAALGSVAVLTLLGTAALRRRGVDTSPKPRSTPQRQVSAPAAKDDDFDDIEAMLRKRGIE
jgi:hypothetical protein